MLIRGKYDYVSPLLVLMYSKQLFSNSSITDNEDASPKSNIDSPRYTTYITLFAIGSVSTEKENPKSANSLGILSGLFDDSHGREKRGLARS